MKKNILASKLCSIDSVEKRIEPLVKLAFQVSKLGSDNDS